MTVLRVLLADDHEVVRMGLRLVLEQLREVRVVAECGSAADAIALCERFLPDVVVMDIRMPPGASGIEACKTITDRWSQIKVILLTSYADDELILEAITAGAVGYVLKQGGSDELARAIEAVREDAASLDPGVTRRVLALLRQRGDPSSNPFSALTAREVDVLRLMADGKTNAQIAASLFLSDKTVRNHISVILSKLDVKNRVEAATFAAKHDISSYQHKK